MFIGLVWWFTNFSNMIKKFHVCLDCLETCVVFFFRFKKKKDVKKYSTHVRWTCVDIFFTHQKKQQRDLDYQACSSDMVGYFFQGFNFFFFEKNTHACSSDMRVILPYTAFTSTSTSTSNQIWFSIEICQVSARMEMVYIFPILKNRKFFG